LHCTTGRQVCRHGGHGGEVRALAFSPDGKRLASASLDGTALVRDAFKTDEKAVAARVGSPLYAVRFSPHRQRLAVGGKGSTAMVFDPVTGKRLSSHGPNTYDTGGLAFSRDGKSLAILPNMHRVMLPCIPPPPIAHIIDLATNKGRPLHADYHGFQA